MEIEQINCVFVRSSSEDEQFSSFSQFSDSSLADCDEDWDCLVSSNNEESTVIIVHITVFHFIQNSSQEEISMDFEFFDDCNTPQKCVSSNYDNQNSSQEKVYKFL